MRSILLATVLLCGLGLAAQTNPPRTSPFGYEFSTWLLLPEITGDNTEATANFSWGASLAGIAQLDIDETFALETGLQIGVNSLQQTVIERDNSFRPIGEIIRELEVDATLVHVGVPVFVKIAPGNFGGYLKLGARGLFNFSPSTSAEIIGPGNPPEGEAALFPPGDVNTPDVTILLEAGIGFRFSSAQGLASYLELNFGRPTQPLLENAGPRDALNRINYLDTTEAFQLGLTFGARFGR